MDTKQTSKIKPMPFWMSLIFFGVPAAIIGLLFYWGIPLLTRMDVPFFWSYNLLMGIPALLMFIAAFVAYRLEGHPFTWKGIRSRLRLKPIKGKEWLLTAGLIVVFGAGPFVLKFAGRWLASTPLFTPPNFLPALLDPRADTASALGNDFWGVPLLGNWGVFWVQLIVLFFNIFGEELWWRGYVLPRQELAHGKWVWVVHGILWLLFHVHQRWNWIGMLPGALLIPFVASKLKNTTPAIIAHWANNGLLLVAIILGHPWDYILNNYYCFMKGGLIPALGDSGYAAAGTVRELINGAIILSSLAIITAAPEPSRWAAKNVENCILPSMEGTLQ